MKYKSVCCLSPYLPGNDVIPVHLVHVTMEQFEGDVLLLEILGQLLRVELLGDEDEDGADGSEFDDVLRQPRPFHRGLLHHQHVLLHVLVRFPNRVTLRDVCACACVRVCVVIESIRILFV